MVFKPARRLVSTNVATVPLDEIRRGVIAAMKAEDFCKEYKELPNDQQMVILGLLHYQGNRKKAAKFAGMSDWELRDLITPGRERTSHAFVFQKAYEIEKRRQAIKIMDAIGINKQFLLSEYLAALSDAYKAIDKKSILDSISKLIGITSDAAQTHVTLLNMTSEEADKRLKDLKNEYGDPKKRKPKH